LDSVSRPEFHKIFERVSATVELKGATTAIEIEKRMKLSIWLAKKEAKSITMLNELKRTLRRELGRRASEFDRQIWRLKSGISRAMAAQRGRFADQTNKLLEHDFAGRAIYEANRNHKGKISLTLRYGRKEADKRILAQKRAEIRSGGAKLALRTPEFRAGLRGLR
jgi:hypothetical protein